MKLVDGVRVPPPLNSLRRVDGVGTPGLRIITDGLVAGPSDHTGVSGHAWEGSGIDHIEFSSGTFSALAGSTRTFSCYIYVSSHPASTEIFASQRADAVDGGYQLVIRNDGKLRVSTYQTGGSGHHTLEANTPVTAGAWNYFSSTVIDGEVQSISVNGNSSSTVITSLTGSYSESSDPFRIGERGDGVNFTGQIADFRIQDETGTDLFRYRYPGYPAGSVDSLVAFECAGGNHGTHNGGESVVGIEEGSNTPPQVAYSDFNTMGEFNGTSHSYNVGSFDWTNSWDVTFSVMFTGTNTDFIMGSSTSNLYGIQYTKIANLFQVYLGGFTDGVTAARNISVNLPLNTPMVLRFTFNGSTNVSGYRDGSQIFSRSISSPVSATSSLKIAERNGTFGTKGYFYRLTAINGGSTIREAEILRSGNDLQIPSSSTSEGEDAFGNTILYPRGRLYNTTGYDPDHILIPDSPGLDVTDEATWMMLIDPYAVQDINQTERFFDRWDSGNSKSSVLFYSGGSIHGVGQAGLFLSSNGSTGWRGDMTFPSGLRMVCFRYNGTAGTVTCRTFTSGGSTVDIPITTGTGTIPATLFATDIGYKLAGTYSASPTDHYWQGQFSPLWIYNRVLSDEELINNHNAIIRTYAPSFTKVTI